jgi:hypothetical protein
MVGIERRKRALKKSTAQPGLQQHETRMMERPSNGSFGLDRGSLRLVFSLA